MTTIFTEQKIAELRKALEAPENSGEGGNLFWEVVDGDEAPFEVMDGDGREVASFPRQRDARAAVVAMNLATDALEEIERLRQRLAQIEYHACNIIRERLPLMYSEARALLLDRLDNDPERIAVVASETIGLPMARPAHIFKDGPGIIFESQDEVRCLLHACESYSKTRRDAGKPSSNIDAIALVVRGLLSPESQKLEAERNTSKGLS